MTGPCRPTACLAGLLVLATLGACSEPLKPVEPRPAVQARLFPDYESAAERLSRLPGETWIQAGTRLLAAGDAQVAEQAFLRSVNEDGVTAEALTGIAIAAEQRGQINKAVRYFRTARQRAPESVLANNNLGVALYRQGEYHAAKQSFQAAFALSDGTSGIAAHNLALAEAAIEAERQAQQTSLPPKDDLVRLGSGAYRLVVRDADATGRAKTRGTGPR